MGRPAKAVDTQSSNLTADERAARKASEDALRGKSDKIKPPVFLTKRQKSIFQNIVKELKSIGILGNLDVYVLAQGAIVIDRVREIEDQINQEPLLLSDSKFMAAKDKYAKEFWRFCSEMCLSPQSRAKIAGLGARSEADSGDELMKALKGGGPDS